MSYPKIKKGDLDSDQPLAAVRPMLEKHAEWLNKAHKQAGEDYGKEVELVDYWDQYGDCPALIFEAENRVEWPAWRVVCVRATPFHDEGGPATLTGFFQSYEGEAWDLRALVMEFDTYHSLIVREGKVIDPA